ncbi:MAG: methyltransferase GidB [Solirubrobacterales bacterium]|nr:methyltransferase GidB [Solirubrobacterales bacterium]
MSSVLPRLRELCDAHGVDPSAAPRLERILLLLAADPTAPTTITEPEQAVELHVADAFDGLELEPVRRATTIADVGAGAGFPGLVLATCLPDSTVSLVEAGGRKCEFIGRLIEGAAIPNAIPVHARAEAWPAGLGRHDLVTARALGPLTALVEYAAPLLADDGHLVAWKGARDVDEEADGAAAAEATGMELVQVHHVSPRPGADQHHLHVFRKVAPTPPRYPRREGMARKRPILAGR